MHTLVIYLVLLTTGSLGSMRPYGPYEGGTGLSGYASSVTRALNSGAAGSTVATAFESSVQATIQLRTTVTVNASIETTEITTSAISVAKDSVTKIMSTATQYTTKASTTHMSCSVSTAASTIKPAPLATFAVTAANSQKPGVNGSQLQIRYGFNSLYFDPVPGGTYSTALLYLEPSTNYLMVNDLYVVYGAGTKKIRTLKAGSTSFLNILCKEPYAGQALSCAGAKAFLLSQFLISNFSGGGSSAIAMGHKKNPPSWPSGYVALDFIIGDPYFMNL